jgi:dedicated sortase system histidine kinase
MRFTIRHRLLLLSVALLSVPAVGVQYLRETERFLQSELERSLADLAAAVAQSLAAVPAPFEREEGAAPVSANLFVHLLDQPIQVDGYSEDWVNYLEWSARYSAATGSVSFRCILGRFGGHIHGLLEVSDDEVIYQRDAAAEGPSSDAVTIVYSDPLHELRNLQVNTAAPGTVTAFEVRENWDFTVERRPVTNVLVEWQESARGYNVEFRLPAGMVGANLGVMVRDVDGGGEPGIELGTGGPETLRRPGRLLQTSLELRAVLERLSLARGRRIWVLDRHAQVLASAGTLSVTTRPERVNPLYRLILPAAPGRFVDDLAKASRLNGAEVESALQGVADTRWRTSPDGEAVIVSAAQPVRVGERIAGAVVVETTTGGIQSVQRRAMANLLNVSLLTYVVVTALLVLFASRISLRLSKLSRDADAAIDSHGRVIGEFRPGKASDEIGDVSRRFGAMFGRLQGYHRYLEGLAGKLVHELRTPIAIVKSSLENLAEDADRHTRDEALARARQGSERLSMLVMRLSEATRLEQAIQRAERETVDLGALVAGLVEGYRSAYPKSEFSCSLPHQPCRLYVSGDLVAQMLDKLVANAVDFSAERSTIQVTLASAPEGTSIEVVNQGVALPEEMIDQLFNSMVSIRDIRRKDDVHLGLGLYIVRLIMEYHGGTVSAENLPGGRVCVRVRFPANGARDASSSN